MSTEQERHILFKLKPALSGDQVADAVDVEFSSEGVTNSLSGSGNVQTALKRIDSTGLGAEPRIFTGSFISSWGTQGNQGTWYANRQANTVIGARGQSNGNYVFELPSLSELNDMFDDLVTRGLGEIFTLTIGYFGGSTSSIARNSLTIRPANVSPLFNRNELPVTIAQGSSVTLRVERAGGSLGFWERVSVQQASDPVATFGEVVIRNTGWNNQDSSLLPSGSQVQKGYAFPVVGSTPNDGTLRQGLLDSGVSDRQIYDGDYVVWTADSFTSWINGDDWFVISRNDLQRLSREESNFLSAVTEIDNRVDVAPVEALANDALVWLSENPLAEPPFLTPSTDSGNPPSSDSFRYIGGRENRDSSGNFFQFSQNRFNSYITLGIAPSFIAGHKLGDIFIYLRDDSGEIIQTLNLETDFTQRTDGEWSNSTVSHFVRNTSINYPFLATVEIWLTQVQRHFRINPQSVDVTQNVADNGITESKLSVDVRQKLNAPVPDQPDLTDIENRISPYKMVTSTSPAHDALFDDTNGTDPYPNDLNSFDAVSAANPRHIGTNVALFVAVPEPGDFVLKNITTDNVVALNDSETTVSVIASQAVNGVTFFIFIVTGLTAGHVYEVDRITSQEVLAWPDDIKNLKEDVGRIDAELEHALLNLPDDVVQVLENEVSVTEETTPVEVFTGFNAGLGAGTSQKVFKELSPIAGSNGLKRSKAISDTQSNAQRFRRKLLYFSDDIVFANSAYIMAFDGTNSRDLVRYLNGEFLASVRVSAIPSGSRTESVYPAQATKVSGAGIWQTVSSLQLIDGIPTAIDDEAFFTRNLPTSDVTLSIQYRGHANGNVFGSNTASLANVGGATDRVATFTLNDGSETLDVEVRYYANFQGRGRAIRVSETARVNSGLPTINDVQVILSFSRTVTVPATPETIREVPIEPLDGGNQVFAFKPSENDNLVIVGSDLEVDTNYPYTTLFGSNNNGWLTAVDENAEFFDFEGFNPIDRTIINLENHAPLPQFGLFTVEYTHETVVALATQFTVLDSSGDVRNVGDVLSDLLTRVTALEP